MKHSWIAFLLLGAFAASATAGAPATLTLSLRDAEPAAAAIAQQIGAEVHFVAPGRVSLDFKDMPAEQGLAVLGKMGVLVIFHAAEAGAIDHERLAGTCTFIAENADSPAISQALSALLDAPVTFKGTGPISLDVKAVPVRQLLKILEGQGGLSYPADRSR